MWINERLRQERFLSAVKENSGVFYRYAYSVLLNRTDAEDAVSEMVLKAFEHLKELKNIHKMRSWMFQILANTCKTMLSKRKQASEFHTKMQQERFASFLQENVQQEWQLPSLHGKMQQGSQPEMPGEAWPQRPASCSGLYQEEYTELWESISQMEQKFREVVLLYYFEGFKTREIARLLNIQEGTVKSRLSRARDKLKKDLKI